MGPDMVGSMGDDGAAEESGSRSKDVSKRANKYLLSENSAHEPEQVPFIGEDKRWYDILYKLLNWILSSAIGRKMPQQLRRAIGRGLDFLIAFNALDRERAAPLDDPMHNLVVPSGESIIQGGIWVVELFPPSHYPNLIASLRKNGWDRDHSFHGADNSNVELITRSRRSGGSSWARIGAVAQPKLNYPIFGAKKEILPMEFEHIEVTATQMGKGLTAVAAFIRLSEAGESTLHKSLSKSYEPKLLWRGRNRPHVFNRKGAASLAIQNERLRLHELARTWLASSCPGFFSSKKAGQPVLDFSAFEIYDRLSDQEGNSFHDSMRALAMSDSDLFNYVSPQVEGGTFVQTRGDIDENNRLENSWGLIGNLDRMRQSLNRVGYGEQPYSVRTLAHIVNEPVRRFLLHIAVMECVRTMEEEYSALRDLARVEHKKSGPRQLEKLRNRLLGTSLDLPIMDRDSAVIWGASWRRWDGIEITTEPRPHAINPPERFDVIEQLRMDREERFQNLLEEDATYRDVLSTAASLGASANDTKLGRAALGVAFVSLLVSALTLVITALSNESVLSNLSEFVQNISN